MIALFSLRGRSVFDPLTRQCDVLLRAARLLTASLTHAGEQALDAIAGLRDEERKAINELTAKLCVTLITPVNHEDLMTLSNSISRVRREVTRATERVIAFGPSATDDIRAVAGETRRTCELLAARVDELRRGERKPSSTALRRAAGETKAVARAAAARALGGQADVVGALQQYDILRFLREANEAAKQTAGWIDYTIIRNG